MIDDYENDQLHDVGKGFIRNWNRHFRTYLAQADSPMDMDRGVSEKRRISSAEKSIPHSLTDE